MGFEIFAAASDRSGLDIFDSEHSTPHGKILQPPPPPQDALEVVEIE